MRYKRFEDLPVWKTAIELAVRTMAMTSTGRLDDYAGFRGQIERAAVSVSNNIAEGFDRGTHDELVSFLFIARGSCAEVRSMLHLLGRLPAGEGLREPLDELLGLSDSISRQLGSWIESLKSGTSRGPRFENDSTRSARDQARRAEAYLDYLERLKNEARPQRPEDDPPS